MASLTGILSSVNNRAQTGATMPILPGEFDAVAAVDTTGVAAIPALTATTDTQFITLLVTGGDLWVNFVESATAEECWPLKDGVLFSWSLKTGEYPRFVNV